MWVILKWEWFKLLHSRKMLLVFILFLLIIVYMYDFSVGKPVLQICVWELPEAWLESERRMQTSQEITTLIQEVEYQGGIAGWTDGYFWIEESAMSLFQEDGALAEKWAEYDFTHTMKPKQYYNGYFGEKSQVDFGAFRKFTDIIRDFSAGAYISMIAPAFFFGTDFVNRGYSASCFLGKSRIQIFLGKYLFYLLIMVLLSLFGTLLPCLLYNRNVLQLSIGYILKGISLHGMIWLGNAALMAPFPFVFRDEWKSLAATFAISYFLFRGNGAIFNLYPFQFVGRIFWETLTDCSIIEGIVLMTLVLVVAAGAISTALFQKTELK